jgi:K+-transporting ATPase ATPase C chain
MLRRALLTSLLLTAVVAVGLGLVYPFAVYAIGQVAFPHWADGSFITQGGVTVGSSLIGQSFTDAKGDALPQYFQSRPSLAGAGYQATSSGASNLGPGDPRLLQAVAQRVAAYRSFNHLAPGTPVPVDAVTASASGLDPEISVANADLQAPRVAAERHLALTRVLDLVRRYTEARPLGFLGETGVNVLELNLALDRLAKRA